jgi:hypothetical protein
MRERLFQIEVAIVGGLIVLSTGMMLLSGIRWVASRF